MTTFCADHGDMWMKYGVCVCAYNAFVTILTRKSTLQTKYHSVDEIVRNDDCNFYPINFDLFL